jgi:hypothetical protein
VKDEPAMILLTLLIVFPVVVQLILYAFPGLSLWLPSLIE